MPKYKIMAEIDLYTRYVAECADEEEAFERGRWDFREGVLGQVEDRDIRVTVERVDDDVPEG